MVFQRAPKPTSVLNVESSPQQNIKSLLQAAETDPSINRHETIYTYLSQYQKQGVDLEGWYREHLVTKGSENIQNNFLKNKHFGFAAELAETLPLFANAQGRLGDFITAKVTKTAKQDDQGNSFIDLVVQLENRWLASEDLPMKNVPSKMTFLVDTTTAFGSRLHDKMHAFRKQHLDSGKRGSVKCFKDEDGSLGIERAKIIVLKQPDYLEKVGSTLGDCVTQLAGDKFSINKPEVFNSVYREYFKDFVIAVGENAQANIVYLRGTVSSPQHVALIQEYEKITAFVEAYKKTPIKRTKQAA